MIQRCYFFVSFGSAITRFLCYSFVYIKNDLSLSQNIISRRKKNKKFGVTTALLSYYLFYHISFQQKFYFFVLLLNDHYIFSLYLFLLSFSAVYFLNFASRIVFVSLDHIFVANIDSYFSSEN